MNIRIKFSVPAILLLLTTLAVCCKPDDQPATQNIDWLTAGAWKLTAASITPAIHHDNRDISDIYAEMDDCQKDDLYTFKQDGKVIVKDAGKRCSPTTTNATTWAFTEDERVLVLDNQPMQVLQLDKSVLRLQQRVSTQKPDTLLTFTYSRQ